MTIIGKFTAFIRWKGKVFHQEFHVTDASPNLLSRDACFRMDVLQTCFAVTGKELPKPETVINKTTSVSKIEETSQSTKSHKKMEECIPLIQCSIDQGSVSKSPLTKQKILDVYADVFEGLGEPYKFKLKENYVPARHAPTKVPIHLQDDFHEEINNLVKQGVLEKVEHSTEWVHGQ